MSKGLFTSHPIHVEKSAEKATLIVADIRKMSNS